MPRRVALASFSLLAAMTLQGAEPKFVVPLPAASEIDIRKDVSYRKSQGVDLVMDVYRPAKLAAGTRLPVIVFMNGIGGSQRGWAQYTGWASLAAANGFVAINPDTRNEGIEEDFDALAAYLRDHAAELHADPEQIGLYACSSHVSKSLPMVEDANRTSIKSAAIYYGTGPVASWRLDLPILLVRAGLDRPALNQGIDGVAAAAARANAPLTTLNHSWGHHGFEVIDDDQATRDVMMQTLSFFKTTLTPAYQSAMRAAMPFIAAAGAVNRGDFAAAARLYETLATANPTDSRTQLAYGEALLGANRLKEAVAHFDKLKGNRELGYRDLGLPAAKAAALAGDSAKAIEWLTSIPARFLPAAIAQDPAFKGLVGSPAFQAVLDRPKN